jgi:hypothetical protein
VTFDLSNWVLWHEAMNKQLLHVTFNRVERPQKWNGHDENKLFLAEFQGAWKKLLNDLEDVYKPKFEREIVAKLKTEFRGLDLR